MAYIYDKGVTQTVIPAMLPVTDHEAPDFTGKKIDIPIVPITLPVVQDATIFPSEEPISVVLAPFPVP